MNVVCISLVLEGGSGPSNLTKLKSKRSPKNRIWKLLSHFLFLPSVELYIVYIILNKPEAPRFCTLMLRRPRTSIARRRSPLAGPSLILHFFRLSMKKSVLLKTCTTKTHISVNGSWYDHCHKIYNSHDMTTRSELVVRSFLYSSLSKCANPLAWCTSYEVSSCCIIKRKCCLLSTIAHAWKNKIAVAPPVASRYHTVASCVYKPKEYRM